ncbi:MAG TPA: PCYCGC motif-containing (lipo)protein [Methylomirabilota bacterium]|nr:PCYCGC motif-containing (lipo)protein [Methylomirabilota bacterium]
MAPVTTDAIGDQVQRLPRGQLPVFAKSGEIRDLYRYAVEHGDELQYVPCFCGCYRFGHQSNRDCYIKAFNTDGTLSFTSHAAT